MTSANISVRERLRSGLLKYGLPQPSVLVYLALLEFGPHTTQTLLQRRVVSVDDIDSALNTLRYVLLIGEQHYRDKLRYYATNPGISWRWQEFRLVWERVQELVPINEVPLLGNDRDQERLSLLQKLRDDAAALFEKRRHSLVDSGRGRALTTEGEYAQACAEVISLAEREIIAVDRPPYTTATLPVFWAAITDRCAKGVRYQRYVPAEEMLQHGLKVVARDIEEVGVDLRIVDPESIRHRFYLIDSRFLLTRVSQGDPDNAVARLSYDKHKIERFRQLVNRTATTARPAREVLPEAQRWASAIASEAARRFGKEHERIVLEIAQMGKFGEFEHAHLPYIRDLLGDGIIKQVEQDRYALALPVDRAFAAAASAR